MPTKGICEGIAFGVNSTPLSDVSHISYVCTYFHILYLLQSRSVFLTGRKECDGTRTTSGVDVGV